MFNKIKNWWLGLIKEEYHLEVWFLNDIGGRTKKDFILKSISKYADLCELGFPHNTPIADGGQIQTSAYRAIKNGIKINDVFSIANQFKKLKKNKPVILMGYYNMIYQYNEKKFITKCKNLKLMD